MSKDEPSTTHSSDAQSRLHLPGRTKKPARVLVADDSETVRILLDEILRSEGYEVLLAGNGTEALAIIEEQQPECIICDLIMPDITGYEICERVKSHESTRRIPFVVITGLKDIQDKIPAIEAGADDFLTKPFNHLEVLARVRSLIRFKRLNDELENANNVVFALARAIEVKDSYTEGHGERVAFLANSLANYVGLDEITVDAVTKGGILHDVGKIGCPDKILNKPGPLTQDEFRVIMKHPVQGWEMCRHLKSIQHCLPCIRWHHEKLDGTGYPDGLGEDDIPMEVRIMSICDIYDALSSKRSYKNAFPAETCFRILLEEASRGWWDQELVKAFVEMMREKGYDKAHVELPKITISQLANIPMIDPKPND